MYTFVPLLLATYTLALPHHLRQTPSTSTIPASSPCLGAPPVAFGAFPGDSCTGSSAVSRALRSVTFPVARKPKKRDGFSTCQSVTIDQYNAGPFKSTIEQQATTNWGSDFSVEVNPSTSPGQPLQFCYTSDTVDGGSFTQQPTCTSSESQVAGNVLNGSATVAVAIAQGVTSTHAVTTEKSTSLASSTEIGVSFKAPLDLADVSVTQTVTLTGTFTQGDTETTAISQLNTDTVTATASKPGPCNVQLNVTSCSGEFQVTIPAFYTGWVWFDYPSTRDGHFKWALNVDTLVPAEQRSDNMTLTDKITSTNNGQFSSDCV